MMKKQKLKHLMQLLHHLADPLGDLISHIGQLGISILAYHSTTILMTTINSKLPYWHHQLVLSWYHHQPESHQQSLNQRSWTDIETPGPIDRTPETPGSGKKKFW